MKKTKKMMAALLAMAMTASVSFTATAATDTREAIKDVVLSIHNYIDIDEVDANVDASVTGECEVDYVECTNEPNDEWDDGDKPKIKVVLSVEDVDKYKFTSGTKVKLDDAKDATITSVSSSSNGTRLTIYATLPELSRGGQDFYQYALMVDDIDFDDASGVATWDGNEYADRYEVRIYRNDGYLAGSFRTTELEYDLSKYFTRKGDYTCKVRGLRDNHGTGPDFEGDWSDSNTITVDSEEAEAIRTSGGSSSSGTSTGVSTGSFTADKTDVHNYASGPAGAILGHEGTWVLNPIGWWWSNPDGSYPVDTWKEIDGTWYYFNADGYAVQDTWVKTNDVWYYCGADAKMVTNTWVMTDNIWFYCGPTGAMWTNTVTPDGYKVNADGAWVK